MYELNTAYFHLNDVERAARRDIAQSRRLIRSRTFEELFRELADLIARGLAPFGKARKSKSC